MYSFRFSYIGEKFKVGGNESSKFFYLFSFCSTSSFCFFFLEGGGEGGGGSKRGNPINNDSISLPELYESDDRWVYYSPRQFPGGRRNFCHISLK